MASPQSSTPYSHVSYPTYSPISVLPAKDNVSQTLEEDGGTGRTGPHHLRHSPSALFCSRDDASCHPTRSPVTVLAPPTGASKVHISRPTCSGSPTIVVAAAPLCRRNAQLQAPSMVAPQNGQNPSSATYYNDIAEVCRSSEPMPSPPPQRSSLSPFPQEGYGAARTGSSNRIPPSESSGAACAPPASPMLRAFQEECESLVALLDATPPSQGVTASLTKEGERPATEVCAFVETPHHGDARIVTHPQLASSQSGSAGLATSQLSPFPCQPFEAPSWFSGRAHSSMYVRFLKEMEALTCRLSVEKATEPSRVTAPRLQRPIPAPILTSQCATASPSQERSALPLDFPARLVDTPEKRSCSHRSRSLHPSRDHSTLCAPVTGDADPLQAIHGSVWSAHLLRCLTFLAETRYLALQRVQSFEDARAPTRRGARGGTPLDNSATVPQRPLSALRAAEELLTLLRSLDGTAGDVHTWTAAKQRHACVLMINLLAEMTAAEEGMMADLMNDAAAGASIEQRDVSPAETSPTPSPLSTVSLSNHEKDDAYRRDMQDTIILLEQATAENTALQRTAFEAHEQVKALQEQLSQETSAKVELGCHLDRLSDENSRLTSQLREVEDRLQASAAQTTPVTNDEMLRNQLDRQTLHLRGLQVELGDAQDESDRLRRTVLHLREALVRHRAVIDLLTRRRRAREAAVEEEPLPSGTVAPTSKYDPLSLHLIEDILSGACDIPSTSSSEAGTV